MNHDFLSIKKILKKYEIINVPYYQRDYVWGSKNDGRNLYKFIDDIFTQYNTTPSTDYFIGTLAFCSDQVNDVIDGQQRLTSLILILSILAQTKCSKPKNTENDKLLMPNGKFVIQEDDYLTEELKDNLGLPNSFNSQNFNVNISKTIDRIKNQIDRAWNGKTTNWYDGLYDYILNKVMVISLEYSNISESLKYFLNINSLSIQLTQSDIFFSILSQSLRISHNINTIFTIKQKVQELARFGGIGREIEGYKGYLPNEDKGIDNIIFIFLNAYYQKDSDIYTLDDIGVGKWMSFYKNEVFNDAIKAKEFTDSFIQYLSDLETIYKYFAKMGVSIDEKSSVYLTWILLQYEAYFDILNLLINIFKYRHNYLSGSFNLFDPGSKIISIDKLNKIAKRINLTLLWNYIRSSNKRLDGLVGNIQLSSNGDYNLSIADIISNINTDEIFNLTYNDKKNVSNCKIKDESRIIKVIMSLQESYLNYVTNPNKDINNYIENILLTQNFSIEHLYSIEEYKNTTRLNNWRTKKSKFNNDLDFDTTRFSFENLSLLNSSSNSSAGTDEISQKLAKYKLARKVCGSEWEYLIQSLADNSEFYNNANIQELGLPKRTLTGIDQNTWELNNNNREFNIKLLEKVLEELTKK
jgi:hypothetical protein